jgi:Tol biopolymer transport system component
MNADGTNPTRLTDNPAIDRNPVLSHDGRMVAFVSNRYGHDNIFIMNADGSGLQRLTNGTLDDNPGWSTNDEEIVYSSLIGFDREIVIMNADGTGKHAITHNNNLDAQPDWSRDGKKIVFNRDYQIAVMNPDGTDSTVLTNLLNGRIGHQTATRLYFTAQRAGTTKSMS